MRESSGRRIFLARKENPNEGHRMRRPKPFAPNERDREIIWLAYDYRFVNVEILHALLGEAPRDGRVYGFGLHGLRARCQKLREHGYLVWQHLRDEPVGRGYRTERPMVYSVGPASIGVLAERTGLEPRQLKAVIARNAVTSFFLRHQVGISKFRACLELACRASDGAVRIGTWLQDGLRDRVRVDVKGKEEVIPVVPDAVFNLFVRRADGRITVSHYFLEYDTGTMSLSRIATKALGLWHYVEQGLQRRKYTYAGQNAENPQLRVVSGKWDRIHPKRQEEILSRGMQTLQILFVTRPCQKDLHDRHRETNSVRIRQTNMIESIRTIRDMLSPPTRMLFCTEDADYGIDSPERILGPVWLTAAPNHSRVAI